MLLLCVLFLVGHVAANLGAAPNAANVTVLKCCPYGETLDPDTVDKPVCLRTVDEKASRWPPPVYSRRRQNLLPANTTPSNWIVHPASRPACGDRVSMVRAHPQGHPVFVMFEEGNLFLRETDKLVQPGRFCVDATAALVCSDEEPVGQPPHNAIAVEEESIMKKKPKKLRIRKCCGPDAVYSEEQSGCVSLAEPTDDDHFWDFLTEPVRNSFIPANGFPACSKPGYVVRGQIGGTLRMDSDGTIAGKDYRRPLPSTEYCVEVVRELGVKPAVMACPSEESVLDDGHGVAGSYENDVRFRVYPALLFLSVFFLAATLLALCLVPAVHQQVHWRCQTNYVGSLMFGDLLLAITQVSGDALIHGRFCIAFAILMHFSFLAAFFWLNTMCFNIWWTFRDLRPASVDRSQEVMRVRLYELYAWGGPLVIAGVAATLDLLPHDALPSDVLRPGFGQEKCWFRGDMEILPYFFGPVGVLLAINLALFVATARELTCGLWKPDGAKPTTERATLRLVCLKLVVVMGVTWVADVVSWAAGGPSAIWYAADLVNALQGVLIFIVVGCQPHVWAAIRRLWCWRESRNGLTRGTGASMGPDSITSTTGATASPAAKAAAVETLC